MDRLHFNYLEITSFFVVIFFLSILFLGLYRKYTIKYNSFIVIPISRSSHIMPTPTGAGFIVAMAYIFITLSVVFLFDFQPTLTIVYLFLGAFLSTIYGFYDDLKDRGTFPKLLIQILLAGWLLFIFNDYLAYIMPFDDFTFRMISIFIAWFFLVWFSNVINFMDGIDGMLASGSMLILVSSCILLSLFNTQSENILYLSVLIPILLGFLCFNFSNSKLFLGDSGSLFLAYFLSFFILHTLSYAELNIWTWLILLGHFLTETTLTTILRIFLTDNWYRPHKSHAYQNLARVLNNHSRVTIGSIIFHILWLLPLAYISVLIPQFGFLLFILASLPVIIFTMIYGPFFSKN